jgi:Ca2+-binding EF-hand superfamily protein
MSSTVDMSDICVENAVRKIFHRLDVDGDGSISWWEWRAVISNSLLDKNQELLIDPMDSLVILGTYLSVIVLL